MRPTYHFIATSIVSGTIYLASKSKSCLIISFIGGFLIDLDHVLDYYLHEGFNLKVRRFYEFCVKCKFTHLTLIFHSLECLILFWSAIYWFKLGNFWLALALGITQHMLFDLVVNRDIFKTPYFYFLTLRILNGFRVKEFKQNDK
mgnify:FL=1